MATFNLEITSDADDGHESEGVWDDRNAEGYSQGEFFSVYQSGNAATDRLAALRFPATGIPQGATITSATLTINITVATSADPTDAVLLVTGDDVDNSPALSDTHRPSSGWTNTTATATENNLAVGATAIDVTSIVQEIVNRPGFAGGALAFKLGFSGSDNYWEINVTDYDADTLANVATLDVITAEGGGTVNTQTLTSSVVVSDASLASKTSGRLAADTITITDAGLDYVFFSRLGSDSVTVTDGPMEFYSVYGVTAISEVTVSDELVAWLRRNRLLQDNVLVTDELISSLIGYLIYTSILTSNVTVADQALDYVYFHRVMESTLLTTDQILRALLVARDLLDGVEVTDSTLTAMQRFILLTDTISLEDALSALYVPDTGPITDNPVIRIGFDQPQVALGGYSVH